MIKVAYLNYIHQLAVMVCSDFIFIVHVPMGLK